MAAEITGTVENDTELQGLNGLLVLQAKTGLASSSVKKYDIIRAEVSNDVNKALEGLSQGEYVVVDPGSLSKYEVSYRVVQDVTPVR